MSKKIALLMDATTLVFLIAIVAVLIFLIVFQSKSGFSEKAVAEKFVSKDAFQLAQQQLALARLELAEKDRRGLELAGLLAQKDETIRHLEDKILDKKADLDQQHERLRADFENLASRLLDEKSQRFSLTNEQKMSALLSPLNERIRDFQQHFDQKFIEETRDRSALKSEIELLRGLNQQLSDGANNLASALKGQSKTQGDWGEWQLESLLEQAGLAKGVHFFAQMSLFDDDGRTKRPDFVIQLPGDRQLIVDSKVSLTAFERWANEADVAKKAQFLKAHVDSMRAHVAGLGAKNYQSLGQLNSPDFLILFVPFDAALTTATQADPKLFADALEKNVVLVTVSTLLATMRTVSFLWKQEKQARSVQEIARVSGLLYDQFAAFVDDLRMVSTRLGMAQNALDDAMNKLSESKNAGHTLVGRAEKIRELGAKNTRLLPKELIERAAENGRLEAAAFEAN